MTTIGPRRSWREIDKKKDRSSGSGSGGARRRDPDERLREKASKSAAYSKYKSSLDKLFTPGGELPESLKAKLGPSSPESQKQRELTDALKKAPGRETLSAYLEAELELPDDARLLMGLLDVQDEDLIAPVLRRLLEIVESGRKSPTGCCSSSASKRSSNASKTARS